MLSRAHDRYLTVMVDENGAARSTDVRARIDGTTNIEREKEAALFNCSSGGVLDCNAAAGAGIGHE